MRSKPANFDPHAFGINAFADKNETQYESLEQKIIAELWRWSVLDPENRSELTAPRSFLVGALEYYLCGIFPLCKASEARGWWCDGILDLTITELSPTSFLLLGAACWAKIDGQSPFCLAPFELEFHFQLMGDCDAQRIVLRFGSLDEHGEIKKVKHNFSAAILIHKRPRRNSDWALAIELS